jgi:hypothetical protein
MLAGGPLQEHEIELYKYAKKKGGGKEGDQFTNI